MASIGPLALGAKGCVERLHPTGETTHYDLCVAGAPANHVRCASLRSGGRRLAVRKTIEYQIGALPRTPFPAAREFAPMGSMSLDSRVAGLPYESSSFATSRGNERYEEKNRGVICFMYYSSISPFGGWRHHLARWEACHWIRGSRGSPMNPVPLPPPQFGGAAKGKRLNGQARRLTSPHLEVLCRTSTGALWVLSNGAMSLQKSIERFILSPGWGGKGTRFVREPRDLRIV